MATPLLKVTFHDETFAGLRAQASYSWPERIAAMTPPSIKRSLPVMNSPSGPIR
jgi:hypothetical protein